MSYLSINNCQYSLLSVYTPLNACICYRVARNMKSIRVRSRARTLQPNGVCSGCAVAAAAVAAAACLLRLRHQIRHRATTAAARTYHTQHKFALHVPLRSRSFHVPRSTFQAVPGPAEASQALHFE